MPDVICRALLLLWSIFLTLNLIIYLFENLFGAATFFLILSLITFLALIYLNSFRENIEDFFKSEENIDNVKTYTH